MFFKWVSCHNLSVDTLWSSNEILGTGFLTLASNSVLSSQIIPLQFQKHKFYSVQNTIRFFYNINTFQTIRWKLVPVPSEISLETEILSEVQLILDQEWERHNILAHAGSILTEAVKIIWTTVSAILCATRGYTKPLCSLQWKLNHHVFTTVDICAGHSEAQ